MLIFFKLVTYYTLEENLSISLHVFYIFSAMYLQLIFSI